MSSAPRRRYAPRLPPDERREQLLDAALQIIGAGGFEAVSVESVAREAGVTRPVVYGVFRDLDELLNALHRREQARALEQLMAIVPLFPGDRDPDEVAVEAVGEFIDAVIADPLTWRLILLPVDGTPVAVQRQVVLARDAIAQQLGRLVAWGVEVRGGPRDIDQELLARTILALAEEGARLVLTDPKRYPRERLVRYTSDIIAALARGD